MRMNRAEDEGLGMRAEELTQLARKDGTDLTVQQRAHGFQRLKAKWQARSAARGGLVALVVTLSVMIVTLTLVAAKLGMFSNRESSLSVSSSMAAASTRTERLRANLSSVPRCASPMVRKSRFRPARARACNPFMEMERAST